MTRRQSDDEQPQQQPGEIDESRAREEDATPEELREINEGRGDGDSPTWWKNEGESGEVQ